MVGREEAEDEDFDDDYDTYSSTITTPKTPPSFPLLPHQYPHIIESPVPELMAMMTPSSNSSTNTTRSNINSTSISNVSTRLRSQSSPNIHPSPETNLQHFSDSTPSVSTYPHVSHYNQYASHPPTSRFDKRKSNGDQDIRRPLYSFDTHTLDSPYQQYYHAELPSSLAATPTATKVKVHHLGSIYVLVVPLVIDYKSLVERIERKMNCDSSTTFSTTALAMTGLKYQDEDGDLITISSNDDLQMGFEQRGINNTVNFYIV
jgi:cell division control protein 24